MFKNILNGLAGNPYEREINRYRDTIDQINELEAAMQAKSDEALRALTVALRERVLAATQDAADEEQLKLAETDILLEVLPEAFAAVREASRRAIGLRHFDVQLIGGIVLHEGKIAEMKTGEGKTLVASLPLYLNALTGRGVHLVTVNDYLARRDGGWMGPIFHRLGLRTGVIGKENFSALFDSDYIDPGGDLQDERLVHWRPTLRRECYEADITYGTAPEFGFDYLRDNTSQEEARLVQRELVYAIVDEVDSVLIDGARTPLIISGPAAQASSNYIRFAGIVEQARLRRNTTDVEHDEDPDGDYLFDDRVQTVALTDAGTEKIERLVAEIDPAAGQSLYDPQFYDLVHYLDNALKAKYIFKRDKDYIVQGGVVILIDQTTGRPMPSRRYSEGLHQAIEAKEGVAVKREDVTIATITVQNYFRLYEKLAGMTGTAVTQAEEFDEVYKLDVVAIPTNVEYIAASGALQVRKERIEGVPAITFYDPARPDGPSFYQRVDFPDQVFTTVNGKFQAVAEEIKLLTDRGRPVLVGTGSVEASEQLSQILHKMRLEHSVLNAKNHDREALIIAQAGSPGAITISTSMAGRGTDILLGGNPEGLAATYMAETCFTMSSFLPLVQEVVDHHLDAARARAAANPLLGEPNGFGVVEWIQSAYADIKRRSGVEDVLREVVAEIRADETYSAFPFETLVSITQNIDLGQMLDYRRLDKARAIAEENKVPLSIIPAIEFRLTEYRALKDMVGQVGLAEALARRMFDQHYNARAAIIRAVLSHQLDQAREITRQLPALPESLIEGVLAIRRQCEEARRRIWEEGGLHVIGTERHESRRIDNQLRGRAARQGDPGSSRFYLSLEDEIMIRFGGDRGKRMLDRLNIPEDMPITANILSNVIEQAQARFETFYFEMRKNVVEYDEAVNLQRQMVYDERDEILHGENQDLDEMLHTFIGETIERATLRLRDGYEDWAGGEVAAAAEEFTNFETGEVNARGVIQRTLSLYPRPSAEEMAELQQVDDPEELTGALHELVLDGIEAGHNLAMLYAEIARVVPMMPPLPAVTQHGLEGWERFAEDARELFGSYAATLAPADREALTARLAEDLEEARRAYLGSPGRGVRPQEAMAIFYTQLNTAFGLVFREIMAVVEGEELLDIVLDRVDGLLEWAHRPLARSAEPGSSAISSGVEEGVASPFAASPFAVGPEEMPSYERALMLSVLDAEWRQYLTAIDDLRQGIGLEAFGQRDPKVEFKRRAAQMFDSLRADIQEGIARRFFADMPQHRQIVEEQKRYESLLDALAQSGYRVEQRVTQNADGQVKVAQTVRKDMWSNVGRNDPCPCGSGKKFKDCHYREVMKAQRTVGQGEIMHGGRGGKKKGRRR
jgi:preprotein translocase subunit SecA